MDISMDIRGKSVDMDTDMDGKFHIHGKRISHTLTCAWLPEGTLSPSKFFLGQPGGGTRAKARGVTAPFAPYSFPLFLWQSPRFPLT